MKVRYADFRQLTRSRTGVEPVSSRAVLAGTAVELGWGVFPLEKAARLLGVAVSGFDAGERTAGEPTKDAQIAFDFGGPD